MKKVLSGLLLLFTFSLASPNEGAAPPDINAPLSGGNFEVRVIKDLAYYEAKDADPVRHKLDLYIPKGRTDFPVVLFVHGGTWRSGKKDLYAKLGDVLARNGIGTVIINYRLSPAVQHPAHAQDVARAFAWTVRNIARYGGKADEVFLSGHSAGGHLAALLATDASYLKAEKLATSHIRGVLALSGVYTIPPGVFSKVFGNDAEACLKASPLMHVTGKRPPFLLVHADDDYPMLGYLARQMAGALRRHKGEATTLEVKGRNHITLIVRCANEDDPTTQAMLAFVARHSGLRLVPKPRTRVP